ncbi:histidine kinase [Microbacterium sp. CFH 31415]|uniref:sensor histidine kinase n=1 Tax=Microbacterium sp. CFH 31415 TaxID=2921732 RepID=UPI001F12A8D6|nr:histidine kinase [Microbacterium sp. CFH 31415]MCH6232006.1 histidine kinase [Microbacterium sp. CFH 31415]
MFRSLKPYQLVVDVVVAGLFAAIALPLEIQYTDPLNGFSFGLLSAVVMTLLLAAALAVRRLSPGIALGVAWLAAIAQMSFGRPPGVADVAIFAVLYATAAYGTQRVFWLGFASSFLGAVVITVYLAIGPYFGSGSGVTWSTIPIALAVLVAAGFALLLSWTVGALVRTSLRARENRRAQERAEAEAVVEQERVRIARDMHDVVAHSLAVVIAQADGARYAASSDPSVATATLATISTTARTALADVRLLLTQLRHSQADGPQPTLADLEALYAQVRAAGVDLRVDVDPAPSGEPPAGVQLAVYRILQEALTNALRHGDGGAVEVRLAWNPARVELEVGNGVAESAGPPAAGHGVIGMRERAQLVGGSLAAAAEGARFVVRASLPIGAAT